MAVNCGYQYYYEDLSTGIVFRPDESFKGGISRQIEERFPPRETVWGKQYDWFIHTHERYAKDSFIYEISLRIAGDYTLLFLFEDNTSKQRGERVFNIFLENQPIVMNLDIFDRAGGKNIPYAEVFEFSMKNDIIKNRITDETLLVFDSSDFKRNLKFTFSKVIGQPKLDAFILYQGTLNDMKQELQRQLKQANKMTVYYEGENFKLFLANLYSGYKPQNEPILIIKRAILYEQIPKRKDSSQEQSRQLPDSLNIKPGDELLENSQNYEEILKTTQKKEIDRLLEEQESRYKEQDSSNQTKEKPEKLTVLQMIDSFWIWKITRGHLLVFFNFITQNLIFLILLIINTIFMITFLKPSPTHPINQNYVIFEQQNSESTELRKDETKITNPTTPITTLNNNSSSTTPISNNSQTNQVNTTQQATEAVPQDTKQKKKKKN